jgi:hypothetical protein
MPIFRRLREQFLDRVGDGPTNLGVERVSDEADCAVVECDAVVLKVEPTVFSGWRLRTREWRDELRGSE